MEERTCSLPSYCGLSPSPKTALVPRAHLESEGGEDEGTEIYFIFYFILFIKFSIRAINFFSTQSEDLHLTSNLLIPASENKPCN